MNILFISPIDPIETSFGGQQRTHVLWRGLKTVGNVWTLVPVARKTLEFFDECNKVYKICFEKRCSLGWFIQRLWSRFLPHAMVSWGVRFKCGRGRCDHDKFNSVKFDVVVSRSCGVAGRLKPWRIAPMYIDIDDTPTVDYSLAHPHNYIRTWMLKIWQNRICRKAKGLWVPDPEQVKDFPGLKVGILPNIPLLEVDAACGECVRNNAVGDKQDTLLFVGYLAHEPNYRAVDWFLMTYWDRLKERLPSLRLRIAGGGLPQRFREKWARHNDVELLGFVDDLDSFYASGCAVLAPMRIGSGTCIKVLEALAKGVPVISTVQGLRGIAPSERKSENGLFVFSDGDTLVDSIESVKDSCNTVRRSAMSFVARNFTQRKVNEVIADGLKDFCSGNGE